VHSKVPLSTTKSIAYWVSIIKLKGVDVFEQMNLDCFDVVFEEAGVVCDRNLDRLLLTVTQALHLRHSNLILTLVLELS